MTDEPTCRESTASVGYGRPPTGVRFQKGQSGNPLGRRKGSKNRPRSAKAERLRSLLLEEAYRPIKVNEDGEEVVMPAAQAALRALAMAAAKGEARALANFIKFVSATEADEEAIEEMLEEARTEVSAEPHTVEIRIVDPKVDNGRPRPFSFGPTPGTKP